MEWANVGHTRTLTVGEQCKIVQTFATGAMGALALNMQRAHLHMVHVERTPEGDRIFDRMRIDYQQDPIGEVA